MKARAKVIKKVEKEKAVNQGLKLSQIFICTFLKKKRDLKL
jgi:hypothetical protein